MKLFSFSAIALLLTPTILQAHVGDHTSLKEVLLNHPSYWVAGLVVVAVGIYMALGYFKNRDLS